MLDNEEKILLYQTDDGKVTIDVRFEGETFWLTQKTLAELLTQPLPTLTSISNIFEEGELDKEATIKDSLIVKIEGSREVTQNSPLQLGYGDCGRLPRELKKSNVLPAVGYEDPQGIYSEGLCPQRRNAEKRQAVDYFDELLERIREIRASERRAYQKIADIFEQCSYDYDKNSSLTREFHSFVQNKLHFAITGTAPNSLPSE